MTSGGYPRARDRWGEGFRSSSSEASTRQIRSAGWRRALRRNKVFAAGLLALMVPGMVAPESLWAQETVQWHGYAQIRYGRGDPATGFSLRRGKLWMGGAIPGVAGLSFKVQGIFRNGSQGAFVLQDLFAEYRVGWGKVEVGQLIPDFSLQRSQPDFLVPLVERAQVVETLIPGARTLGRDIGIQMVVAPSAGSPRLALGLFNGSGANHLAAAEADFLATGRFTLTGDLGPAVRAVLGGSLAWRRVGGLDVGTLSPTGDAFVGEDFRWGAEARLAGGRWEVQGEYLRAVLEGEESEGFYLLGTVALDPANRVALSVERVDTPAKVPAPGPWIIVGGTHVFSEATRPFPQAQPSGPAWQGPFPTQLMGDLRVRSVEGELRCGGTLQLQLFFH